jgi:diguanylate cyclase (GGDEF)-like protein
MKKAAPFLLLLAFAGLASYAQDHLEARKREPAPAAGSGAAAAEDEIKDLRRQLEQAPQALRAGIASRLALALARRGEAEQTRQDHPQAQRTFREALSLLQQYKIPPAAPLLKNAGLTAIVLGEHHDALDLLQRAETLAADGGDRETALASTYLLGYVYRDLENHDLALKYFQAAMESAQATGNQRLVIMSLNEIGNVHLITRKFDEALSYKERSLKLAREYDSPELLANSLHDMGELHSLRNQPERALPLLREALAIDRRNGLQRGLIISLYSLANSLHLLGRNSEALAALEEARPLAERAGQNRDLASILSLSSIIHEQMGEFRLALKYHRLYHELWARLFDEERARQTVEMQTRYEVEKKQRENELLRREKEIAALAAARQRGQRNFLLFAVLLALLLAGVLFLSFRAKAKANRWLEEANERIVAQQGKLEQAYRQMEQLARRDPLTGLANRRAALEEIEREEVRGQRSRKPFTLVMADLVGFKAVNDSLGHDAGDAMLREAATLILSSLRAQDTVARWGGDEFLLLLPETDAEGAAVLRAAIQEKFARHEFVFHGAPLRLTISLGAATCHAGMTAEECLRQADQAMYRSRDGRTEG